MQSVPITMKVVNSNPARVMDTTVCDKVCQWTAACRWFSPGIPVSSTQKIDSHDIADILVKVALNIIILNITLMIGHVRSHYNIKQVATRWRYSRQALWMPIAFARVTRYTLYAIIIFQIDHRRLQNKFINVTFQLF
jgi:hypothetical protein